MSDTPATPEETPAEEYTETETTEAESPESGEAEAAPDDGNKTGWDGTPPGSSAEADDAEAADDPE